MSHNNEDRLDSSKPLDSIAPYPQPQPGFKRHAIYVEPLQNEHDAKVELVIGKTMTLDGNRHWLGGQLKETNLDGWGYTYYVLPQVVGPMSTMMFVQGPPTEQFITINSLEHIRYNSRLPIVVYAPEDMEVKYRIWKPSETLSTALVK
ncbi:hypothetical protein SAMD00019534_036760 [Acytostelium subglobosum LB1]|uniref:hypothetical protein n=1 Tax=Acytostelium subglobosum LB1 TaxID=1410327 RepID=UPI000644D12C|nr:hypothetical protein SAMD00019534_036760 [Acytostelium subglobosum LB1]GAM20501.1 hypothetical protein SAMD00019534_036760 [Acytostelium subglobosum LB1]|eukprot:XP_012760022.1 hypothetical protein SAMD00019534_036760 [Acytostelium subglobosum LB1]